MDDLRIKKENRGLYWKIEIGKIINNTVILIKFTNSKRSEESQTSNGSRFFVITQNDRQIRQLLTAKG